MQLLLLGTLIASGPIYTFLTIRLHLDGQMGAGWVGSWMAQVGGWDAGWEGWAHLDGQMDVS